MKKLYFATTLVIICFFVAFFMYRTHQARFFSCTAHFQANNSDTYLRAMLRFTFTGKEGTASLRGEVKDEQNKKLTLNRLLFFSFTEKNNNYKMSSVNVSKENNDRVDDAVLQKLIYVFYLEKNKSVQYNIIKQKNGDYVIYNGSLPLAYCHNNER
ncbi:hypothetical protein MUA02_15985 [Enterobacteriaceae bacterium H20N1]|uniref:Uncharacterized protein n=1 Tax=Dryocola boscaweniae TaxID=2925397 RepID=A0A9X3AC85_9ENTR|nr:hypothetical protein [Dryocola boscaweniae]MCT4703354.1 hypothetical protein [Dryocola boscaweniae]MCT4720522.1 hypothetical protein [Dryocola boscaweniae]